MHHTALYAFTRKPDRKQVTYVATVAALHHRQMLCVDPPEDVLRQGNIAALPADRRTTPGCKSL